MLSRTGPAIAPPQAGRVLLIASNFPPVRGGSAVVYDMLAQHAGGRITVLAPRTDFGDEGGPDFQDFDTAPFWFGATRRLLELPVCRDVVGWAGALAPALYRPVAGPAASLPRAVLSWLRCAERITLSPEGNDTAAMRRLVHRLAENGRSVLTISFHSSSLAVGHNPYVGSQAELHQFYDRLSALLDGLAGEASTRFAGTLELVDLLTDPATQPC